MGLPELISGKIKLLTKLLKYWEKQLPLGTDKKLSKFERENKYLQKQKVK